MSGGGGIGSIGSTAPLLNASNSIFGNTPWDNTGAANAQLLGSGTNPYQGISNLNTNPAAQYGGIGQYGQDLAAWGINTLNAQPNYPGYANQALATGFNQNNGLYNQMFNQNQQQANAENAMAGVATTPYGAALTNQSDLNFNNQWQQFLSGQQAQAANTASTLGGTQANTLGAGGNALTTGLGIGQSIDTQQYNAQQGQIQDYLNYLLGNTQNSSAYLGGATGAYNAGVGGASVNNAMAQTQNAANSSALGGLGSLAGSLLKYGYNYI